MNTNVSTVGSFIAGGVIAAVTIIGVVNSQTSPNGNPTNVNESPTIDYGTRS